MIYINLLSGRRFNTSLLKRLGSRKKRNLHSVRYKGRGIYPGYVIETESVARIDISLPCFLMQRSLSIYS